MRPIRARLAVRLMASFLVPTIIGLAAIGLMADHVAQRMLEGQLSERLVAIAQAERSVLSGFFAEQLDRVSADDARSLANLRKRIEPIAQQTGVRRVFVFRPDELTSLVDTDETVPFGHRYYELEADAVELAAVRDGASRASVLYTSSDGTPYKNAYAPILHPETQALVAVVGVEGSTSQLGAIWEFRRDLTYLGLVGALLVLIAAFVVSRRLNQTVFGLVAASRAIGEGRLDQPVRRTRTDELGDLQAAVDRMREALRSREEELQMMLSGIAHEVRNPLGGIEIFLGLLDEDLAMELLEEDPRREHVAKISRELEYLARVVKEFLEYARQAQLELTRFTVAPLVEEVAQVMARDADEAGVRLVVRIDDGLEMTADRDRLRRVLLNLVRNACQASHAGSEVVIIGLTGEDQRTIIRVEDRGSGIALDKLEEVFRPFYTSREKGTGLGLPLARKVVEAHGGSVRIESEVGLGSKVVLDLPFFEELRPTSRETDIPEGWLG